QLTIDLTEDQYFLVELRSGQIYLKFNIYLVKRRLFKQVRDFSLRYLSKIFDQKSFGTNEYIMR
ncbi:hypothetical protein, partial [Planktothrix agardhii]|uniref:hypothetical protein n=1 Tax=Planktothrix agardhii TaxID=1160 RepID=UPI0028A76F34